MTVASLQPGSDTEAGGKQAGTTEQTGEPVGPGGVSLHAVLWGAVSGPRPAASS